ncbi:MAG: ankyrin repeat domain-containing protein [Micavibrio sp.]|nr:ankyrin repeat domain-containing protein [Micavibrio sp.]
MTANSTAFSKTASTPRQRGEELRRLLSASLLSTAASGRIRQLIRKPRSGRPTDLEGKDRKGNTALMLAVARNRADFTADLIKQGASLDARNLKGETALLRAIDKGYTALADMLLAAGANTNIAATSGTTPLLMAAKRNLPALAEKLLAAGADCKAKDENGADVRHFSEALEDKKLSKLFNRSCNCPPLPPINFTANTDRAIRALPVVRFKTT